MLGSAEERREAVLDAAIGEFAARGLHGASTERMAREAGISHSYVFKLFGTKRGLFLAATERVYDRVHDLFRAAAASRPEDALAAMGVAYGDLLTRRRELLLLLHGFAASDDREVGRVVRERYGALYRYAQELSGASDERMRAFWAHGMLMTVAAAIDLPSLSAREEWAATLLAGHAP
jgi:AcrR family transcriptional regulator